MCFTNIAACAAGEAGGEGAKGEAESHDPGFAPDRLGDEASGLLAAAGDECGPLSFAPETRVTTDHGKQAIGTLQVGERVLAYNAKTGKMELEPILHVWINHDNDLVDLTVTTMTQGQHGKVATKTSEVVHTNQKHPFLTLEQGFLPVGKIKLGMHLLRADGRVGVVTGWKVVPGTEVMYNLEVAQDHTFTVGAGQWVVHNRCFPNRLPGRLRGEQQVASSMGVSPLSVGDPGLEELIQGSSSENPFRIKWAVNTAEELGIIPYSVDGTEIHHSVIFDGADVLAAGEGYMFKNADGAYELEHIDTQSGHYAPIDDFALLAEFDNALNTVGIPAFKNAGVIVPDTLGY